MKIWLNDLKEGSEFYHIFFDKVYRCKHLGHASNTNYRMPRIKFKVLDYDELFKEDLFGNEHEAFVNQYVYDNKEEAIKSLIEQLTKKINDNKFKIEQYKLNICDLESNIKLLENTINKYI